MRIAIWSTGKKVWPLVRWLTGAGLVLSTISLALAQEVRNVCSPAQASPRGCPLSTSYRLVCNPKLTEKIFHRYEDSLVYAKDVTNTTAGARVKLSGGDFPNVTTPPRFYSRDGQGPYYTLGQCMEDVQNIIVGCITKDGPVLVSLNGGLTNENEFPVRSVNIQCVYRGVLAPKFEGDQRTICEPCQSEFQFQEIIGPKGSIPLLAGALSGLSQSLPVDELA
jgi:hypothetical protein